MNIQEHTKEAVTNNLSNENQIEVAEELCESGNSLDNDDVKRTEIEGFKKFLQLCNETPYSLNLISKHDFESVGKSPAILNEYLNLLLENFYNNFDNFEIHRDIFYEIYKTTRESVKSGKFFSLEFEKLFQMVISKIYENRNWYESIMFGILLSELPIYEPGSFLITTNLMKWMKAVAYSAADGNENAFTALMLILRRLSENKNIVKENLKFNEVSRILRSVISNESKKQQIDEYFNSGPKILEEDITEDDFKKVISKSKKCQDFEKFIKFDGESYDISNFSKMSDFEIDYLMQKVIETAINNPKRINFLVFLFVNYQYSLKRIRSVLTKIVAVLEKEFNMIRKGTTKYKSDDFVINLGAFIGELYVNERRIISSWFLSTWLSFWAESENQCKLKVMIVTLENCGFLYKIENSKDFYKFIAKMYKFAVDIKEKKSIDKIQQNSDIQSKTSHTAESSEMSSEIPNQIISKLSPSIMKIFQDRMFKPEHFSKPISDIQELLKQINKNKNKYVQYKYDVNILGSLSPEQISQHVLDLLNEECARPLEIAQFLKSFFEFSFTILKLQKYLKANLVKRANKISIENIPEMTNIGKFAAELRTFLIIDKNPQYKWLEIVEKFKPLENQNILEIQLEVLKLMMVNLHAHDNDQYMKYLFFIKEIESKNIQYSGSIKFKLTHLINNLCMHEMSTDSKNFFDEINSKHKVTKIPENLPEENSDCYDLEDFTKSFFLNATSNTFLTKIFRNFVGNLEQNSKSDAFLKLLKNLCHERFDLFIKNIKYFDECEASVMLKFFALLYEIKFFNESEVKAFLDAMKQIKNSMKGKCYLENFKRVLVKHNKKHANL